MLYGSEKGKLKLLGWIWILPNRLAAEIIEDFCEQSLTCATEIYKGYVSSNYFTSLIYNWIWI